MSDDRSEYTVTINGIEHTLLLTAEDAKAYGDDAKKASGASAKTHTPPNKGS